MAEMAERKGGESLDRHTASHDSRRFFRPTQARHQVLSQNQGPVGSIVIVRKAFSAEGTKMQSR